MQHPSRANNIAHARETGSALPVDLQNVTVSCFAPSHSSASCPPREACAALARTCGWGRGCSVWVDEPRTRWSAWCPACAVITQIVAGTHKGLTMEKANRDAHLCSTMDSKPWSLVLFAMISHTWEDKPNWSWDILITHVDSFVVFAAVHVKLFLFFCFLNSNPNTSPVSFSYSASSL